MITSSITIQNPIESPEDCKASIMAILGSSGVTDYELTLESVDVNGCRFSVQCEDTDGNYDLIVKMCGALNTTRPGGQLSPAANARSAHRAVKAFQYAGSEGRFSKENPPPPGAK